MSIDVIISLIVLAGIWSFFIGIVMFRKGVKG